MIKYKYTNKDNVSTTIETESMDCQELVDNFSKFMEAVGFKVTSIAESMIKYSKDNEELLNIVGKPFIGGIQGDYKDTSPKPGYYDKLSTEKAMGSLQAAYTNGMYQFTDHSVYTPATGNR